MAFLLCRRAKAVVFLAGLSAALTLLPPAAATSSHPLTFAIDGASQVYDANASVAFSRLRGAGFTRIMTSIGWAETAPAQRPASWNPSDPNDPNYNWSSADVRVKTVTRGGFVPVVLVGDAPSWARLFPAIWVSPPDASDFGAFMRAAAERYSGKRPGLPRVRFWQVWNEPNISLYFAPQYDPQTKQLTSPDVYRGMVNAAAASVHAARTDNILIAGSTAPFRDITPEVQALDDDWGPLKFMRRFLCVDDAGRPTCNAVATFDVWATHPYTSGGPTHHAVLPYDVSLGDLPEMHATLNAAVNARHIKSLRPVRFWANEFSWDSNPPDPCSPPMALLKRWIPEAFYRMWANGIDSIAWYQLMDDPMRSSFFQSGLYFNAPTFAVAKPKPLIEAFRFPFVALRRRNSVYVWAHTPFGKRRTISIQQSVRGRWQRVKTLSADGNGILQRVLKAKPTGEFRAVLAGGETSLPFSMRVPPDQFFNPFGMTLLLEPNGKSCNS